MLHILAAGSLILSAAPAGANVDEGQALAAYAQARAADALGELDLTAQRYAAALALSPGNEVLAGRALRQALAAGDRSLAVEAARILDRVGELPPEGRVLLMAEALRNKDWREAAAQIDTIEKDEVFSFMTPLLRAWLAQGTRKADPLVVLEAGAEHPLASAYAAEHRPLLLLLTRDRRAEGVAELAKLAAGDHPHSQRLRIAGAALLARKGDRKQALALLEGNGLPIAAARARLEARKPIAGEIATPQAGVAAFLVRLAVDLNAQKAPQLALSFARLATFLAPENSETWLVTGELLAVQDQHQAGLDALAHIPADDFFAATVDETRIQLLAGSGRQQEALAQAKEATARPDADQDDWTRLGDLYIQLKQPDEAAEAYGRAIALSEPGGNSDNPRWTLWLMRGSALIEADKWGEAKAALERAYKLAPREPMVLNYLGYSQLERRENMAEAERLIDEASRLRPDDAAITDSLGWAHYLRGNLAQAIKTLERAVVGQPADPSINEHLGDAYYSAGRRVEARYAWSAALVYADEKAAARLRAKIEAGLKPKLVAP